ncbi:hypothetical protein A1O1_05261 [Capronia coronata CBS 617.96]|uniref:C2H2-type domain-containing protein n=1 Tax=Capronia coronata CBS 617.96 TaxID=1182541 RepID=W9YGG0_9EURO|nr:uncharacterized protein A1O1_05261 [Capronia coronata CBS 617.96]EXJ88331.1 hypothetical protein A1O1_05261 [Capronia coronata CBS 617.96]
MARLSQSDTDDDFDLDEYEIINSEDELPTQIDNTPASTPPSSVLPPCRQKTLKCPYDGCDKAFNRQARLSEHIRSHTNTRPFTCPHPPCTKAFLRASHLKHHVKSAHTDVRDYKCTWPGCDASFATGTRLRRHVQAHEVKEKFTCRGYPGCNQTFRKQETLDRHILSAHQNIKPFQCTELDNTTGLPCTKAYDTAENLRTHQRAKHDPTRFSCSDCIAKNASILANAQDDGPQELEKTFFATYGEFQAHVAEKHPPTCSFCPTSFGSNKELTRHLEIQHGILSNKASESASVFPCTYSGCNKKFTKKGNLNVHVKTVHENHRDFVCGQTEIALPEEFANQEDVVVYGCGRSFTSKASLEEHVRTAHLGLESKRALREKKRKVEQDIDEYEAVGLPFAAQAFKKRKTRSDKGTKKLSVMASLTGVSVNDIVNKEGTIKQAGEPQDDSDNEMDDDENDNLLSGDMALYGSQLWHQGNPYHYPSGEYPTLPGVPAPEPVKSRDKEAATEAVTDFHGSDFGSSNCTPHGIMDYQVDDDFFGQFEEDQPGFAYPPPQTLQ